MQLENWMCPKCYKTHWSIGVDESDKYIVCKGCGHKSPNIYRVSGGRGILPENEEVEKIILKKKHNEENDVLYLKKKEFIEYLKNVRPGYGSREFQDAIDDVIALTSKTTDYYEIKLFVLNVCKESVVHPTIRWEWLNEKLYEIFYGKTDDDIYQKMLKKVKNMLECGVDVDPEKLSYFKSLFIDIEESFFGFKEVCDALKILSEREKYLNGWHKHRQRAEWVNEFIMILVDVYQKYCSAQEKLIKSAMYKYIRPYSNRIKINEKLSLEKILNYIGKNITLYDVTDKYMDAIEMIDSTGLSLCDDCWYIKMKQSEHVSTENLFDDVDIAFSEFKRLRKT
jgi:hypothetical protein